MKDQFRPTSQGDSGLWHPAGLQRPELVSSPETPRRVQVAVVPFLMPKDLAASREFDPLTLTIIQERNGVRSVEFAGGTMEEGDGGNLSATALREIGEELGLREEDVTILVPPIASGDYRDNPNLEPARYHFLLAHLRRFIPPNELYAQQQLQPHERILITYQRFSSLQRMKGKEIVEPRSLHAMEALEPIVERQVKTQESYQDFFVRMRAEKERKEQQAA